MHKGVYFRHSSPRYDVKIHLSPRLHSVRSTMILLADTTAASKLLSPRAIAARSAVLLFLVITNCMLEAPDYRSYVAPGIILCREIIL